MRRREEASRQTVSVVPVVIRSVIESIRDILFVSVVRVRFQNEERKIYIV